VLWPAGDFLDRQVRERIENHARARRVYEHIVATPRWVWPSLAQAARIAGMERTAFSRWFHKTVGLRYREFLRRMRLLRAVELLHAPDASVKQVADECGFESAAAFSRFIKRHFGTSPARLRNAKHRVKTLTPRRMPTSAKRLPTPVMDRPGSDR
jgi:AraC-like DNA-binding protein